MSNIRKNRTYGRLPRLVETPPEVFFDRRRFVGMALAGIAGAALPGSVRGAGAPATADILKPPLSRPDVFPAARNASFKLPSMLRQDITPRLAAATHNNFYEFLPGRGGPAWQFAGAFEVEPWKVEVKGLCNKPRTFDLDDLFSFAHEERLYHFRCVERWAMNVPWSGFPLRKLLEAVEPTSKATHVRFVSAARPSQMPGLKEDYYPWPYHEALRLDEATNELAFGVTGAYGEPLLKQHGAPLRIAVPWKYGYKNPKSIVQIELVAKQPGTFWSIPAYQHEYGFLSNANPNIPHPRWSQERSYWLDTQEWFPTPIFNGYGERVAALYPDEPRTPQTPLHQGQVAR